MSRKEKLLWAALWVAMLLISVPLSVIGWKLNQWLASKLF